MKVQIVNHQSKLVRSLHVILARSYVWRVNVAGPYGGIANPLYATQYTLYALFIFALLATFCAQTTYADGSIVAWGSNFNGQCDIPSPNSGFVTIAAGWTHSLGLKEDGSIVAWGDNGYGQCNIPSPNNGFIAINAGYGHSLGLKEDGSIIAWGYNYYGECDIPLPNSAFIAIDGGGDHSLGLKQNGSIVAWGYNGDGQCDIPSPNSGFIAIVAGDWYSLGLKEDCSIVAWGKNDYDQCDIPSPNSSFIAIAATHDHSLGLKQDGSIVAWGRNSEGQCDIPLPNSGFIAIAAGGYHSLAFVPEQPVEALVDISPDSLNKNGKGQWVTVYITLPEGYDVSQIDVSTIAIMSLTGESCQPDYYQAADVSFPPQIGDWDEDGILDLTVKFDRQVLIENLCLDDVAVTVEGELSTGQNFKGTDHIRVLDRDK